MNPTGLVIGEGFQNWINANQATPESDEMFLNTEMRCMMARAADANGNDVRYFLIYNGMVNTVTPFVQATL